MARKKVPRKEPPTQKELDDLATRVAALLLKLQAENIVDLNPVMRRDFIRRNVAPVMREINSMRCAGIEFKAFGITREVVAHIRKLTWAE